MVQANIKRYVPVAVGSSALLASFFVGGTIAPAVLQGIALASAEIPTIRKEAARLRVAANS